MRVFFLMMIAFLIPLESAQWGRAPEGWDDLKFGVIDGGREPYAENFTAAIDEGIKIDYRYVYITILDDVSPSINPAGGFLLAPNWGWLAKTPAKTRPSITIYFIQQGGDASDGSSAMNSAADATYMGKYFRAIAEIADSCKGRKPIYVIEPDVWGYLLKRNLPQMSTSNLSKICHITDLGIDWLSDEDEFENTIEYLPKAIIKTLKIHDPDCYAGILMANWQLPHGTQQCIDNGKWAGTFVKHFLKEPYRGDFMGIEKNGTAAGVRLFGDMFYWDDTRNSDYLGWCKALGQEVDLPIFGWQISLGYVDAAGYDPLPNANYRWEDTYFQYFFKHVDDFIDAGFIGFDAGCNDRGIGTCASVTNGVGDNKQFFNSLIEFNKERPYDLDIVGAGFDSDSYLVNNKLPFSICSGQLVFNTEMFKNHETIIVDIINSSGCTIKRVYNGKLNNLLNCGLTLDKKISSGAYFVMVTSSEKTFTIPFVITK